MKTGAKEVQRRIREAAELAVAQMVDADSSLAQAFENNPSVQLAINSSFLYRDKRSVKTVQSSRRVAVKGSKSGKGFMRRQFRYLMGQRLRGTIGYCPTRTQKELYPLKRPSPRSWAPWET
jgi:hypothetical protein